MRSFPLLLTLLALITLGLAETDVSLGLDQLPACAQSCLITAVQHVTCDFADKACLCTDTDLQHIMTMCVTQHCTVRESLTTKNVTETTCNAPIRNKSKKTRVINIALGITSIVCVLARLTYKGLFSNGEFGADDFITLFALVACIPQAIVVDRILILNGLGRDVWTVPFDSITAFARGLYSLMIIYFFQIALVKLSLLLFYLRIFPRCITRKMIQGTIVVVVLFGISFSMAAIFTCWPVHSFWTNWDTGGTGKCFHINSMSWINAGISIGLDVWMLALPLYEVSRLQLSWHRKLSASFMFLVGTFVTFVSIMRLRSLIYFNFTANPTWVQTRIVFTSVIEVNVGIICVCLPSMRVMFVRMFPRLHTPSHATSQRTHSRFGTTRAGETGQTASLSASVRNSNTILFTQTIRIQHDDGAKAQFLQMEDLEVGSPTSSQSSKTRPSSEMDV